MQINEATTRDGSGSAIEVFIDDDLRSTIEESIVVEILVIVWLNIDVYFWFDYVETAKLLYKVWENILMLPRN